MLWRWLRNTAPGTERGLRHDDPALRLTWTLPISVISDKDRAWPLFDQLA